MVTRVGKIKKMRHNITNLSSNLNCIFLILSTQSTIFDHKKIFMRAIFLRVKSTPASGRTIYRACVNHAL